MHPILSRLALARLAFVPLAAGARTTSIHPRRLALAWLVLAPLAAMGQTTPHAKRAAAQDARNGTAQQPVKLKAVKVEAAAEAATNDAGIGGWGDASVHATPAAITVVGHEALADWHVRTLSELARTDAALGDNYAPVGYYQDVSIRGYPLDLATGYRINGLTVVGAQNVALENKQRVEILQGLAGLQAGVMEPGGIIDYVTKRPADVRTLTLGTDSHGSRHTALDVGRWLTPTFGVRANLAWQDIHSYVQHSHGRRNFYSLAVDWLPSARASLQLDSDYQASAQRSVSGYQLLGGTTPPPHADATRMLGFEPWQEPVVIHASNTDARFTYAFSDAWQLRAAAGHSRSVIDDAVAFAYGCYYVPACADGRHPPNFFAPNGDYDVYDFRSPDDTRTTDQVRTELHGQFGNAGIEHHLSVGLNITHHRLDQRAWVYDYVGTANIADVDPPYFPPSPNQPGPPLPRLDAWQRSIFAQGRVDFGTAWRLIAGARRVYLHERTWAGDGTPPHRTWLARTLPHAALLWLPDAALTTYVSYSEGLSLGEQAPGWVSNAGAILGPRLSRQVEAGAKYRWSDGFHVGAALYRMRRAYQFAQPDPSSAGFTFVQQGEEVHSGLEVSADGAVSPNVTLHAGVAFIRARAQDTGTPAYEGHQVQNVPTLRGAVYTTWRIPALPNVRVLGGWRYAAPNVATPDGRVRVPAYSVFDAGVRYRQPWRGHTLTWRVSIDNLFNRIYWRDTGSSGGDSYLFPGAPRSARLSLTVAW